MFYGLSAGIVTPIRLGEYVGRKLPFDGISLTKITVATVIEKFASLFIVLLIGSFISIHLVNEYVSFIYSIPIILLQIITVVFILVLVKNSDYKSKTILFLYKKYSFIRKLKLELSYVKNLNKRSLKKLFVIALILYLVILFQYALLAKSFNGDGNFLLYIAVGAIVLFVKSILSFVSFADLGIRETTSVLLFEKLGYTKALGFNSAIFLFLFNLVIPSIIGLFLMFKRKK